MIFRKNTHHTYPKKEKETIMTNIEEKSKLFDDSITNRSETYDTMYRFEHDVLPIMYFKYTPDFIEALSAQKENMIFGMINDLLNKKGIENPYHLEDFKVDKAIADKEKDIFGLSISFPETDEEPLCKKIYLIFNNTFERPAYFTIEAGGPFSDYNSFICSWDKDKRHYNHGSYDKETNFLEKCLKIYG